ncbi:hypothetical protein FA13DRAFT_1818111 [Coprinellus micaceus]|uniref:NACHT domain-containing protein n=1 Tax=Coprinellus micaceus TaxID=71717 RepID=A0A4Y7SQG6_COPMI|nr:hypothetical protein FA13DRAFT_1818111 [Coprinellus micaceus]
MPWPFRRLSRKVKSLLRSRSGRAAAVNELEAAGPSSAPPSATAGQLPPVVDITPSRSMLDRNRAKDSGGTRVAGRSGASQALANPPTGSSSERLSVGAFATSGTHSQSARPTEIALIASYRQPVHESAAASNTAQLLLTPPLKDTLSASPLPIPLAPSASYFSNSRDFTVSQLNVNNGFSHSKTLFEYLSPHISHGAVHDSSERCDAPACHEETRVAIRDDIVGWIRHGDENGEPKKIMWLSGPAGAGKTAIAGSVAETCKQEGILAASFFFSSFSPSADRRSKRGFIATLAYHISQNEALHQFKEHLHTAVERHPDIFYRNLKEQTERLLLGPFRLIRDRGEGMGWPKVIIIDGLDEVVATEHEDTTTRQHTPWTSEDDQLEILDVLLALSQSPTFPFRVLVASRPERVISDFFASDSAQITTTSIFLDSKYNPDADIKLFLEAKFSNIRRRAGISVAWPGQGAVDHIVDMSSGQFIVPATVIRWVESGVPQRQLDDVLKLNAKNKNPFASLDALYHHILQRAHNPTDDPHLVVKWLLSINSAAGMGTPCAMFWRGFLEDEEGELSYRLAPITSLVSVPPPNDTSSPMTIYHKSLADFLSSPTRCGELYVKKPVYTSFISERILVVLKNKGPVVPLPSAMDLANFLEPFFNLDLLCGDHLELLTSLSNDSKAELSSCDSTPW